MDLSSLKKKNFKLFIDTSTLLDEHFNDYLVDISSNLKKENTGIIIVDAVISELEGHCKSSNRNLRKKAELALELIDWGTKNGILAKMSDSGGYADNIFQAIFTKFRAKYNLCLITQDNALGKDILKLNQSSSVDYIKQIRVFGMRGKNMVATTPKSEHKKVLPFSKNKGLVPFKKRRKAVDSSYYNPINKEKPPEINDTLKTTSGLIIKLTKKIASGGEGSIYKFKTVKWAKSEEYSAKTFLAKIYHSDMVDKARIEKINLLIKNRENIKVEGVCFPISILYNDKKEAVGYTMKEAGGSSLQQVFPLKPYLFTKPLAKRTFDDWNRLNLITLCINIIEKINVLHRLNILLGDINPQNILIDKNANVYFIDTDSYQIENYPCPVGTATFTHPDLLKASRSENYKTFLRTQDHERFAVSTLIFMILLPGLTPYSYRGGSNPLANVKKRQFVFPFVDKVKKVRHIKNEMVSEGQWRFIWSHLPFAIKNAFYKTFVEGEMRAINDIVVDIKDEEIDSEISSKIGWLNLLNAYYRLVEKGISSDEIYPGEYKKIKRLSVSNRLISQLNWNLIIPIFKEVTGCTIRAGNKFISIQATNSSHDFGEASKLVSDLEKLENNLIDISQNIFTIPLNQISKYFKERKKLNCKSIYVYKAATELKVNQSDLIKFLQRINPRLNSMSKINSKLIDEIENKYIGVTQTEIIKHLSFASNVFTHRYKGEIDDLNISIFDNKIYIHSKNKNIKQVKNDFKTYLKNQIISFDIIRENVPDFIGNHGKNLDRIRKKCIQLERKFYPKYYPSKRNIITVDRDNNKVIILSGITEVQELVFKEVQKLDLEEKWATKKTIFIQKKSIHNIVRKDFFNAINIKLSLSADDYFLSRDTLEEMLTSKKPMIRLFSKNKKIEKKIITIIEDVNSWKYTEKILLPIDAAQNLSLKNKNKSSLLTDKKTLKSSAINPLKMSIRIDNKKTKKWIKKHKSIGEFVIRGSNKKDVMSAKQKIIKNINNTLLNL